MVILQWELGAWDPPACRALPVDQCQGVPTWPVTARLIICTKLVQKFGIRGPSLSPGVGY